MAALVETKVRVTAGENFDDWCEIEEPPPGSILTVYVEDRGVLRCKRQAQNSPSRCAAYKRTLTPLERKYRLASTTEYSR